MNRIDIATREPHVEGPARRVREEVRDGVAVAAASIAASVVLVLFATLLMRIAG